MIGSSQDSSSGAGTILYPMRLQKFLARAGVASRRGSENLMTEGRVKVKWGLSPVYIILNKPAGYVTTMNDPQGRPCVAQLVPTQDYPGLYPVGRLDRATRGLLLFTTDGEMGHGLLHPRKHVEKIYLALVEGHPSESALEQLRKGIQLDDRMTLPCEVSIEDSFEERTLLRIAIHEGRYRQVRRMCAAIHHECLDLQRIRFGPLELGSLPEGSWRHVTESELNDLLLAIEKSVLE